MREVSSFLLTHAEGDLLPWKHQAFAAEFFNLSFRQVELVALESGLLPCRYQRNRKTISKEQQLQLFRSHVAVIGCGGLGGYIVEQLSRLGVGNITAIDHDVFEEHNLNRQLYATPENLGTAKVEAARARVAQVNPAVKLIPHKVAFSILNGFDLLEEANIAVDALDSIPVRLELSQVCAELDIPLVHGAIGGWYGHVASHFPGDTTLQKIYRRAVQGKGIEKGLGNPSFTPAVVASMQVSEVCKILLNLGTPLRNRKLHLNLLDMEIDEIQF